MLKSPHKSSLRSESKRRARALVAVLLLAGLSANTLAQGKLSDVEKKFDDVSQKVELLERSTIIRFEALDKVRAAELKALEDKLDVKKDLADVKGAVAANAQKSVDWWLAWFAAFVAVFGIGLPYLLNRELTEKLKNQLSEVERLRDQVVVIHDQSEVDAAGVKANHDATNKLHQALAHKVEAMRAEPLKASESDVSTKPASEGVAATAGQIAESKEADVADRLFAKGFRSFRAAQYRAAAVRFAAVVEERPDDHDALNNWGVALGKLADAAEGEERRRLRLEEISKYEAALKVKPDKHEALNNWGSALGQLADAAEGEERRRLRLEQISKYEAALKVKPDKHDALNNWGVALGKLADAAEGAERRRLRLEQISKYEAALKVKPDDHEALYNWGVALGQLADAAEGEERPRLRLEQISKYEAALKVKPDKHEALNNWGVALGQLADAAEGEERRRLRLEQISKYEAALKVKPDKHEALDNWGSALLHLVHGCGSDDERRELIAQAEAVLQRHAVIAGHASYNLACVAAMRRDAGRFVEIADGLPDGELPDLKHLRDDIDLDGVRETPEFQAWWTRKFGHEPLVKPVA